VFTGEKRTRKKERKRKKEVPENTTIKTNGSLYKVVQI
jgi:hypothetical protein